MTRDEMQKHMASIFADCQGLRNAGQKEYAHSEDEAFSNFMRVGKYLETAREKVLLVYLLKHIDGITAYVNGHKSQRESVHGRIRDAIVYLTLLDGMIAEDSNKIENQVMNQYANTIK